MRNEFLVLNIFLLPILVYLNIQYPSIWYMWLVVLPLLGVGWYDFFQKENIILRNFPLLGRGRYIGEGLRPKIRQYFVESDIDGAPINRLNREVVYARSEKKLGTSPFGTQLDIYEEGYEWLSHSIAAKPFDSIEQHPKIRVGGPQCTKPYEISIYNISAMSYGSLSNRAVEALNGGASIGGFAHNTGEGGVSPYHLALGGDVIWQIGTGYFGCRADDGNFSPELFKETVSHDAVKMVELKLSQGAKPGHGGILPAKKNTVEIAAIRKVKPGIDVLSPPNHKAFDTPVGLLEFIQQMRELAGGIPVGFKLCIGKKSEFIAICKAILKTGIYPDFISVDGGEGGTGAAPLEFSNHVGMPLRSGLSFVYNTLVGFGIKDKIMINASGKIINGFHIFRAKALGADFCSSARGMMMALGCIQALECNKNSCPTGIATQNKELIKGLVVTDKKVKVANFHHETVHSFVELLAAAGLSKHDDINRTHLYRRVSVYESKRFDEFYPYIEKDSLLEAPYPNNFGRLMNEASAERW